MTHYISANADCFDPDSEESDDSILITEATNDQLVEALNQLKGTLLTRLSGDHDELSTRRSLHYQHDPRFERLFSHLVAAIARAGAGAPLSALQLAFD